MLELTNCNVLLNWTNLGHMSVHHGSNSVPRVKRKSLISNKIDSHSQSDKTCSFLTYENIFNVRVTWGPQAIMFINITPNRDSAE